MALFSNKTIFKLLACVLVLGLIIFSFTSPKDNFALVEFPKVDSSYTLESSTTMYEIPTDSFDIVTKEVKANQFLADILLDYNVPYPKIHELATFSKELFNVKHIRAGDWYTILTAKDSLSTAQYFIYQKDAINYVVCDLRDTINIYEGKKPVTTEIKSTQGVITSSLSQTLSDNNSSPVLALEMSNIYAWTIDFYGIQKGDHFKVIYEQQFVDGKSVGIGKILSAQFNHFGSDYYAVYLENDSIQGYFDNNGISLRKAFLKSPLKFSRMTSGFTYKRFHPVQKKWKAHLGTDYAAPKGTPILSTGDGVVIESRYKAANGNYVKIKHNSIYTSQYLHMTRRAKGMKPGRRVRQGEVIGYVGSTGLATGPHVCYRFWKNGSQINHLREEFPPVDSLSGELLIAFNKLKNSEIKKLESL